jgi:hypothetical protein
MNIRRTRSGCVPRLRHALRNSGTIPASASKWPGSRKKLVTFVVIAEMNARCSASPALGLEKVAIACEILRPSSRKRRDRRETSILRFASLMTIPVLSVDQLREGSKNRRQTCRRAGHPRGSVVCGPSTLMPVPPQFGKDARQVDLAQHSTVIERDNAADEIAGDLGRDVGYLTHRRSRRSSECRTRHRPEGRWSGHRS